MQKEKYRNPNQDALNIEGRRAINFIREQDGHTYRVLPDKDARTKHQNALVKPPFLSSLTFDVIYDKKYPGIRSTQPTNNQDEPLGMEEITNEVERMKISAANKGISTMQQIEKEARSGNKVATLIQNQLSEKQQEQDSVASEIGNNDNITAASVAAGILGGIAALVSINMNNKRNKSLKPEIETSPRLSQAISEVEALQGRARESGRKGIAQMALESLSGRTAAEQAVDTLREEKNVLESNGRRINKTPVTSFDRDCYKFFQRRRGRLPNDSLYKSRFGR